MAKRKKQWKKLIYRDEKYKIYATDKLGWEISGDYMLTGLDMAFIGIEKMKRRWDLDMFDEVGKSRIKVKLIQAIHEL